MISRAPRSQFLRKLNTPPAPLRQCSKWLPFCLTCGILLYRRLFLFVLVLLAQAVPTSSTPELMVRLSSVNKTTDYSETAVCLLCYPGEGNAPRGLGP